MLSGGRSVLSNCDPLPLVSALQIDDKGPWFPETRSFCISFATSRLNFGSFVKM